MTDKPQRQDCHVHINCAHCLNCHHEFMVAQNPGQEWYTCPECKTTKSRLQYAYRKPDPVLTCECKNTLFHITQKGAYCPNCGADVIGVHD